MKKITVEVKMSFTYDVDDDFDADIDRFEFEERAFEDLSELVKDEYFNDFEVEIREEDD